jgi:hypothetical protein
MLEALAAWAAPAVPEVPAPAEPGAAPPGEEFPQASDVPA